MRAACVLAIALLGVTLHAEEDPQPPSTAELEAGYGRVVSAADDSVPVARMTVDGPLPLGDLRRIHLALQAHGATSASSVRFEDVRTFEGLELDAALEQEIGRTPPCDVGLSKAALEVCKKRGRSYLYFILRAGGAVRRNAEGEGPSQRYPGWLMAGLALDHRDAAGLVDRRITVTFGADELSSPHSWSPNNMLVTGHARLFRVKGVGMTLGGEWHRRLAHSGFSVVRVQSLMSYQWS